MAQQDPETSHEPSGDPWHAVGYLVSGVGFYGLVGWLADRWLGTSFLVALGIVVGAVLGVYLTWSRFKQEPEQATSHTETKNQTTQEKQ